MQSNDSIDNGIHYAPLRMPDDSLPSDIRLENIDDLKILFRSKSVNGFLAARIPLFPYMLVALVLCSEISFERVGKSDIHLITFLVEQRTYYALCVWKKHKTSDRFGFRRVMVKPPILTISMDELESILGTTDYFFRGSFSNEKNDWEYESTTIRPMIMSKYLGAKSIFDYWYKKLGEHIRKHEEGFDWEKHLNETSRYLRPNPTKLEANGFERFNFPYSNVSIYLPFRISAHNWIWSEYVEYLQGKIVEEGSFVYPRQNDAVVMALVNLGYKQQQAINAVKKVIELVGIGKKEEELIKMALKIVSKESAK